MDRGSAARATSASGDPAVDDEDLSWTQEQADLLAAWERDGLLTPDAAANLRERMASGENVYYPYCNQTGAMVWTPQGRLDVGTWNLRISEGLFTAYVVRTPGRELLYVCEHVPASGRAQVRTEYVDMLEGVPGIKADGWDIEWRPEPR